MDAFSYQRTEYVYCIDSPEMFSVIDVAANKDALALISLGLISSRFISSRTFRFLYCLTQGFFLLRRVRGPSGSKGVAVDGREDSMSTDDSVDGGSVTFETFDNNDSDSAEAEVSVLICVETADEDSGCSIWSVVSAVARSEKRSSTIVISDGPVVDDTSEDRAMYSSPVGEDDSSDTPVSVVMINGAVTGAEGGVIDPTKTVEDNPSDINSAVRSLWTDDGSAMTLGAAFMSNMSDDVVIHSSPVGEDAASDKQFPLIWSEVGGGIGKCLILIVAQDSSSKSASKSGSMYVFFDSGTMIVEWVKTFSGTIYQATHI